MANLINILDENVINRIAAGEVIERPVSVVKELIENSIDARASFIRLDIENGGKKSIVVKDDGAGMSHDDAFLALERHATSKLRSEKDLLGIATMGFRGEALASIASVSRIRLVTSDGSDDWGTEIIIEGGTLKKSDRIGMGRGTIVEVRNLFYNVPVRRKFLKGTDIEAGHIQEQVLRLALAFPSMGLTYTEDGRLKMDAPAVPSTFERIHTLYSKDIREHLVQIDYSIGEAGLHGYVARPPYARANMRSVLTFVNGRAIRDRLVNAAVTRAFSNLMERGRYPIAVLFIELPPDQVDVNVHPQKAEVRFVKSKQVFDLILDGVHQAITGAPFSPPAGPREQIFPRAPQSYNPSHLEDDRGGSVPSEQTPIEAPVIRHAPNATAPQQESPTGKFSSLGILGKLPNSFLVLYSEDELVIMDHHAAHERILFDSLTKWEDQGATPESQDLLIPVVLEYSPIEARLLGRHLDLVRKVGFRIEEFGENDFVIKGVPGWLHNQDLEAYFAGLIEVMLNTGLRGDPRSLKEELLKRMACRAASKESDSVQPEEMRSLLKDLDRSGCADVCPHGRPLTVRFPFNDIRRRMGRN
ncbi:MAG: DNA mismatch repair endonuclease MutL [Deltaproteobacteria bacterium]|nr:DNA mismatch repair endonuclease MutL [Deltaproteobacteria bacterium]